MHQSSRLAHHRSCRHGNRALCAAHGSSKWLSVCVCVLLLGMAGGGGGLVSRDRRVRGSIRLSAGRSCGSPNISKLEMKG